MLGLTRLPPWFEKELARFESVFSDSRNVESFTTLVSAVILAKAQWTVSGLSRGISRPDGTRNPTVPIATFSERPTGRPQLSLNTLLHTSSINSTSGKVMRFFSTSMIRTSGKLATPRVAGRALPTEFAFSDGFLHGIEEVLDDELGWKKKHRTNGEGLPAGHEHGLG